MSFSQNMVSVLFALGMGCKNHQGRNMKGTIAYLTARPITETSGFYRYSIPMGLFLERIFINIISSFLTTHPMGLFWERIFFDIISSFLTTYLTVR